MSRFRADRAAGLPAATSAERKNGTFFNDMSKWRCADARCGSMSILAAAPAGEIE
jgi:hypothetical protein